MAVTFRLCSIASWVVYDVSRCTLGNFGGRLCTVVFSVEAGCCCIQLRFGGRLQSYYNMGKCPAIVVSNCILGHHENGQDGREDLKQDGETALSATWVLRGQDELETSVCRDSSGRGSFLRSERYPGGKW